MIVFFKTVMISLYKSSYNFEAKNLISCRITEETVESFLNIIAEHLFSLLSYNNQVCEYGLSLLKATQ